MLRPLGRQGGERAAQQLLQVGIGDHRHIQHRKAGYQRLVELAGAGVAVVHGADKAGGIVQRDALVARHVDDPPVIQRGVEHRQRLIFGHVHLVQHTEAAQTGAAADRPLPEHHLALLQGVRADKGGGVHVDVHGYVPHGAAEHGGQILRQHVLAGGLRPRQQQVLAAQQRSRRALPDRLAVVEALGYGNARLCLGRYGVRRPKVLYLLQQRRVDALVPQLLPNIHNLAPFLLLMPYYTPTRR